MWRVQIIGCTVYPKKYAHGFVVLCFVVVMQSFIMNSHAVFIHINRGCFAGTGAIVRLPQCQRSKPDGYGKISQCITTTKHSKAKTVCIFLGIYCIKTLMSYSLVSTSCHLNTIIMQNFWKILNISDTCQGDSVECLSKIMYIFTIILHVIYGAEYHPFHFFSRDHKIFILYRIITIKWKIWFIRHCWSFGQGAIACAICFAKFL